MSTAAIIGAGCSGLAAAQALRDAGHMVTVFEKSSEVGGRTTTRRKDGCIFDPGAQYIKGSSTVVNDLLAQRFHADDLIDISKPVWIFNGESVIQEGDSAHNAEPKWNYRGGLIRLAERMAAGLDVRLGVWIAAIRLLATGMGWRLFDEQGEALGDYERLVIAFSAGEARDLLEASQLPGDLRGEILMYLEKARYNPLLSVTLGYTPRPLSRPYYALVNTDKAHAISWLAWEHEKAAARAPAHIGLFIAQMSPAYSLGVVKE